MLCVFSACLIMSKATCLVIVYSLVLIVLFCTFCYLMTTVNPAPIKQDPGSTTESIDARKFGSDDFLYPNDVIIPHDNVAFGLEKVQEYDAVETERPAKLKSTAKYRPEIPTTFGNYIITDLFDDKDGIKNRTSKEEDLHSIIMESKNEPLKGLRRSVSHDDQNIYLNTSRSLVLKVNNIERKPQIEIKILTEQEDNSIIEFLVNNKFGNQNNTRVKLNGSDTFIVNIIEDVNETNSHNKKYTEGYKLKNKFSNQELLLKRKVTDTEKNYSGNFNNTYSVRK